MESSRRRFLRVPSSARVDWTLLGACTHHISTVRDWSRDGLFIDTSVPKETGDVIRMRMEIQGVAVQLEGVVVRRCARGMGVRVDGSCTRFL